MRNRVDDQKVDDHATGNSQLFRWAMHALIFSDSNSSALEMILLNEYALC